jgi:hypothetical protein
MSGCAVGGADPLTNLSAIPVRTFWRNATAVLLQVVVGIVGYLMEALLHCVLSRGDSDCKGVWVQFYDCGLKLRLPLRVNQL